jgi:hypothetical protein
MTDATTAAIPDRLVCACFRLGWQMEELFSRLDVPKGPQPAPALDRLIGLSKLTSYDQQRLGLDEVDFVLDQVAATSQAPNAAVATLTADARGRLDATLSADAGAAQRHDDYLESLARLHVDLLTKLTAAGSSYGKAYGLGRALADTARPRQDPGQLAASFQRYRIGQLYVWLDDLDSLLPPHAARAVAQSLTWWQQAVTAAAAGQLLSAECRPATYPGSPATSPVQKATSVLMPGSRAARPADAPPPATESLAAAVSRQGTQWLRVLDGEKQCTDLLTPQDYVRAGERLARTWAGLAVRMLRTMPWLVIVLVALLAAVVLALIYIPGSAVARAATGTAAIAATLSAIWKLIQSRLGSIAAQVEQPLWGAELNVAAAEAITVPPLGASQDPAWESAFAQADAIPAGPIPAGPSPAGQSPADASAADTAAPAAG